MRVDVRRTSAFGALSILLGGYVLIVRPLDAAVDERYAALDAARATLAERLSATRNLTVLERERQRRADRVRRVLPGEHRAAVVDRFLRTVAVVSHRDDVAVEGIAASVAAPAPASGRTTPAAVLEEVPLELTLRGRYADVIRAARDLNAVDGAARITLGTLANAQTRPGERPQLNAAFHVALLREPDVVTPSHARAL